MAEEEQMVGSREVVKSRRRPSRAERGEESMSQSGHSRHERWIGNLLVTVGSLAVLFGAAEMVSALFVPAPTIWLYPQELYVYDPKLLHRLKPNQRAFTHSFPVITNSYGLRNEEFPLKPRPGVVRILCLGDSLTFGKGVAFTETYPKQLEIMLNASGRGRYEVINGGVSAYDTWQEVTYLREDGWEFQPDLVIIGFYGNDIVPRPRHLDPSHNGVRSGDRDEVMRSRADWGIYWLKRSRILLLLRERVTQLMSRVQPSADVSHKLSLLRGTANDLVDAGWREIDSSFEELAALARKHHFGVLVVFFPMADEVVAKYPNASYPARAREIAARHGIPALDLLPAFARESPESSPLFIAWDGHPNARAYAIAAREIKDYVMSARVAAR